MKLALFFTRGVSLEIWVNTGLFDREKLIYEEHLKQGNFEGVYWLTYGSGDSEIASKLHAEKQLHSGIQVVAMPRFFKGRFGTLIYSFLIPLIQHSILKNSDIYKTNQMDGSWSAVIAKWIYKKPLIVRTGYTLSLLAKELGKPKSRIFLYRLMEKLAFKYADYMAVSSENDKRYILKGYNILTYKLSVSPNYINANKFKPHKTKKFYDRIVFVGRLSKEKNIFNLIKAVSETGITLDVYGRGELEGSLREYARKEKAKVNFMGTVPNSELPDILNRYKYFILPSYFEGMPKSLLEAMACGLVVIGTNVGGIRYIIQHKINGFLCEPTADSIVATLNKLLLDRSLCEHLVKSAREFVVKECSLDRVVRQELVIFCRITGNKTKGG